MLMNYQIAQPKTNQNVVSILSGGLDSTILTHLLVRDYGKNRVLALTFDYNQKHRIEIEKSKQTCLDLDITQQIINIDFLGDLIKNVSALSSNSKLETPNIKEVLGDPQPLTYVPYRNMLFLTLGLSFAESNNANYVFTAVQSSDLYGYWDTTPEFIERINKVSELNRKHQIKIEAPFSRLSKKDEILLGNEIGVDFAKTHTCYDPLGEKSCGKCPSCSERIKNFIDAGIKDPIPYNINIDWSNNV